MDRRTIGDLLKHRPFSGLVHSAFSTEVLIRRGGGGCPYRVSPGISSRRLSSRTSLQRPTPLAGGNRLYLKPTAVHNGTGRQPTPLQSLRRTLEECLACGLPPRKYVDYHWVRPLTVVPASPRGEGVVVLVFSKFSLLEQASRNKVVSPHENTDARLAGVAFSARLFHPIRMNLFR